jgi:hypothetical protein
LQNLVCHVASIEAPPGGRFGGNQFTESEQVMLLGGKGEQACPASADWSIETSLVDE